MSPTTSAGRARAALGLLGFGLFSWCGAAAVARADVVVDTADQARGVAPRIELELGPAFSWGLGHACRQNPLAQAEDGTNLPASASEACSSGFGVLGGQALLLFRPLNHWAIGPRFAYDAVLGAHQVYVDGKGTKAGYGRHAVHLAAQLRWYSRRVMQGGLYLAAHGGILWWTDSLERVAPDAVTRSAPELGLELGGVLAPYRGTGMTLGLQSWIALFPGGAAAESPDSGTTYDYSPFVFFGVFARIEWRLGF